MARLVALGAGIAPDDVTIDRDHHRATAKATPLPGATLATYNALERRMTSAEEGWQITVVPPLGALPTIRFADNVDTLDDNAKQAVLLSAWAALRWNMPALEVPGLPKGAPPEMPDLSQRRGIAIATLLRAQGVAPVAAPAAGQVFALSAPPQDVQP